MPVPGCYHAWHLPLQLLLGILVEEIQEKTKSCKGGTMGPVTQLGKEPVSNWNQLYSLLAVLPGASFPDALFPCSLPTVLRVLGIISVQQCLQWCEWQLYLPWSPSPTKTKTREKESTLSTLSAPHSVAPLLSLPFQQSNWKGLPLLCSLCCTPLAPHPPCFCLHLSTVEGLQIPLSSQNVLHNFQLLNSLTFENVQCWPVVPSWNPLLPHRQTVEPFCLLVLLPLTSTPASAHSQAL